MSDNKKRLFQILDEMNVNDEKNKTATLPCSFTMVEAKSNKQGGLITMGVEPHILQKIMFNEMRPMLVVLDMKEYHRIEALPPSDELTAAIARAERAEKALKDIANPIAYLQRKAEEEGCVLNGNAFQVANDPEFLKGIANNALTPKQSTDE